MLKRGWYDWLLIRHQYPKTRYSNQAATLWACSSQPQMLTCGALDTKFGRHRIYICQEMQTLPWTNGSYSRRQESVAKLSKMHVWYHSLSIDSSEPASEVRGHPSIVRFWFTAVFNNQYSMMMSWHEHALYGDSTSCISVLTTSHICRHSRLTLTSNGDLETFGPQVFSLVRA